MPAKEGRNVLSATTKLVFLAMFAALSIVLVMLIHFPIFPSAAFLEYDPADIPILIGTFLFGPWTGLLLTVVTSIIQGVTVSAASGPIGIIMHIFATGIMVIVCGLIYSRKKTLKRAILSLVCGALAMTVAMLLWNYLITPLYMGVPRAAVAGMLLPIILPFNLIKAGVNCLITFFVYKPVSKLYKFESVHERTERPTRLIGGLVGVGAACIIVGLVLCYFSLWSKGLGISAANFNDASIIWVLLIFIGIAALLGAVLAALSFRRGRHGGDTPPKA